MLSVTAKLQKLRRSFQNKWRGMLNTGVVLLHDNAVPHTARRPTHLQGFSWRCLIIHHIARISRPAIFIFSYTSRNSCPINISVFRMTERRSVAQWFQSQARTSTTPGYKSWSHGMKKSQFWRLNVEKIAQH